jgi:hypothetical protein
MKETICDLCKTKFTSHDEYVNASVNVRYIEYLGDDGSNRVDKHFDLCKQCLYRVIRVLKIED